MPDARFSEDFWTDPNGKTWKLPSYYDLFKFKHTRKVYGALKEYVFNRDGNKCKKCCGNHWLSLDHVIPYRISKSHHPNNLQCLCHSCNSKKVREDRRIYP